MNVQIIIDSTADALPAVRKKCTVVPVIVRFGQTEYLDGVTIDHKTFNEKLAPSNEQPTTSQPTPDTFSKFFQTAIDAGQQVVVLTISAKLSGTYQSAAIAAMDYPGQVFVVDSHTVTIGTGLLAQLAVELAEQGANAEQIVRTLEAARADVRLVALVDTLEYLKKGGRISKTVAFAGELLAIKPIIQVLDGELGMVSKARGNKQATAMLDQQIAARDIDFDRPMLLGYTGLDPAPVERYAADSEVFRGKELYAAPIGSVVGPHAGPGAYAAAFFAK